jgi:hypothetical protein
MERIIALSLACVAAVLLTLVFKAAVIAFNLSFSFGRPQFCRRIHHNIIERPWRSTMVGVANTVVALVFILILLNQEPLALVGIAMAACLCAVHLVGRTAWYRVVAERLCDVDEAPMGVKSWLRGAVTAELSFLVPVLGQVLFIVITLRCAGACILALLSTSAVAGEPVPAPMPKSPDT